MNQFKKATTLSEFYNAVDFNIVVTPDHEFFTEFSDVRGDFEDQMIYKSFKVNPKTFVYSQEPGLSTKPNLFLAGMRGSGKTSELAKISKKLHNKNCFFCVTCNLDEGLSTDNMEYMDIVIFQMERLFEELEKIGLNIDNGTITSLQSWFSERVKEINHAIKQENGFEMEIGAETPSLFSFLKIAAKLKSNLTGSRENADKIRMVFRNNFTDFARKFNEVIEKVSITLREIDFAREILFIIDGLEKTATSEVRKKVIEEITDRIRYIQVNTIFTLPIELMSERPRLIQFSKVVSFPFVKIVERDGTKVAEAIDRFRQFVYRRIDQSLFESTDVVDKAIMMAGGSPRELLRILQYANLYADEDAGVITMSNLDKGIKKLAAEDSQFLTQDDLNKLKELKEANIENRPMPPYNEVWQDLLEKQIVLEYNDGTYKRVRPVIEISQLYQYYVG
jgi:hypothetical protein